MEASANAGRSGRSLQDLATGMFSLILSLRTSGSYGEEAALRQRIADYLAGMTDRFAMDEHRKLFDPHAHV